MSINRYMWLLFILLAIVSGIVAFDCYVQNKWINFGLFTIITIAWVVLAQISALSFIQKTEKILLAIQKKDFSLFPETEENNLVDNAVKLYG